MSTEWTHGAGDEPAPLGWRVMVLRDDGWETIYLGNSRADARAARQADRAQRARIERVVEAEEDRCPDCTEETT